jgi:hypothetical protein
MPPDVAFAPGFDKSTPARIIDQVSEKVGRARRPWWILAGDRERRHTEGLWLRR